MRLAAAGLKNHYVINIPFLPLSNGGRDLELHITFGVSKGTLLFLSLNKPWHDFFSSSAVYWGAASYKSAFFINPSPLFKGGIKKKNADKEMIPPRHCAFQRDLTAFNPLGNSDVSMRGTPMWLHIAVYRAGPHSYKCKTNFLLMSESNNNDSPLRTFFLYRDLKSAHVYYKTSAKSIPRRGR